MTAQAHDLLMWRAREYLLVGVEGGGLFNPYDHGLRTIPTTTANWRGCVVRYAIKDDRLVVEDLHDVGLPLLPDETPPTVNGVTGVRDGTTFTYPHLNMALTYTGRLLIARGFIQSLYRHMGFHPAWKFEESWELDLDAGRLIEARDTSSEMALFRKRVERDASVDPDYEKRPGWLERTFTLAFRRSKGP